MPHLEPDNADLDPEGSIKFDRRAEVEALWDEDETVAGEMWRLVKEGKSPQEIAGEFDITLGPVYGATNLHKALLDGSVSTSPTVASQHAGRLRKWLKTKTLSPELRATFEEQERLLNAVVNDSQASAAESEEALKKSEAAEAEQVPGIYVYTLPHYVRHPYDPKTGRTLMKVGHSSVDAMYRANVQTRVTSLPEDPWLLRIYPADRSSNAEQQFHGFLRDADHDGVRGTRTGREWFLTSLKFLDRIARSQDLEIREINDFEIVDE